MKKSNVTITETLKKTVEVEAETIEEAEIKVDDIIDSTDLLDVKKGEVEYIIEIESEDDIDDESNCDDCPYYDGEECLFDELY